MKKIMSCLLVVGMMAGCTQQPVNPPIEPPVDEPETIDEVEDILEIKEHMYNVPEEQKSESKNELFKTFSLQIPLIKNDSEEAISFNQKMNEDFEKQISDAKYDPNGYLRTGKLQGVNAYLNENVLSIVLVYINFAYETSYQVQSTVYNYNIQSGEFMDNQAFFDCFDYDRVEYEEKLSVYLTDNFVTYEQEDSYSGNKVSGYDKTQTDRIYLPLVEPVFVYMKDGSIHVVAQGNEAIWPTFFDIEIK